MKHVSSVIFLMVLGLLLCGGCVPRNSFLINSQGIATYNRRTGQFEILWETKNPTIVYIRDSVREDSITK